MATPSIVVERWFDAVNRHDAGAVAAVLSPDFVWELGGSSTAGAAASAEAWRLWFVGFPDFAFERLQTVEQGDTVCTRVRMVGTHRGEFRFRGTASMDRPLAPTGKSFDLPGCAVHQVAGDRITRLWAYWDTATLMRQLGVDG